MRVLVVEDQAAMADALERGLRAEGFDVDVAVDGVDGLWRAREFPYDVIALDVMLPGINGFEICRTLRRDAVDVPILMLTAKDGEYDIAEGLELGADDYLTKPFSFVELVARVPYMAWEHVGHIAQTQNHRDHAFDRKIQDRVLLARDEQDNEFWHLLIMEEFCEKAGYKRRWFLDRVFPQILSFLYYQLSWLLYVVRPKWSYQLNSDFEDHAMRQYAEFVAEHPEFDATPWESEYRKDYGFHVTVGDMLRQIAVDEEQHKDHSEDFIRTGARFSKRRG